MPTISPSSASCTTAANRENAEAVAGRMIQAEADRCFSHGLFRMPWYVSGVKSGRVNGHASPTVERLAPGVLRNGRGRRLRALGATASARPPLMDCAREQGIAALAYVNMFHIAALWPETEALAEEGFCAFAFTGSYPYVAPAGGKSPLFGTNPMGFAWPRKDRPPLVFDQASAAMARGEIQIAARDGPQRARDRGHRSGRRDHHRSQRRAQGRPARIRRVQGRLPWR